MLSLKKYFAVRDPDIVGNIDFFWSVSKKLMIRISNLSSSAVKSICGTLLHDFSQQSLNSGSAQVYDSGRSAMVIINRLEMRLDAFRRSTILQQQLNYFMYETELPL